MVIADASVYALRLVLRKEGFGNQLCLILISAASVFDTRVTSTLALRHIFQEMVIAEAGFHWQSAFSSWTVGRTTVLMTQAAAKFS